MESQAPYAPITEDWLRSVGFKWHQLDRQPDKQWLLWLGDAISRTYDDLGLELAPCRPLERADYSGRYSRFVHIRKMKTQDEVIRLIEALTCQLWDPENHWYGALRKPEDADRLKEEYDRLDRKMVREGHPWRVIETDDSLGRALPEHLDFHQGRV